MSEQTKGSYSLWKNLYDDPTNMQHWTDWLAHYQPLIYGWARQCFADDIQAADDVFANVTYSLYKRITNRGMTRVLGRGDTFRPYVYTCVQHACADVLNERNRGPAPVWAGADDAQWREMAGETLAQRFVEQEEIDCALAGYVERYKKALVKRKTEPQYYPHSSEIFFKRYHDRIPTDQLKRHYGFSDRDTPNQYARRVRDRLVRIMGLPAETKEDVARSNAIVVNLARVYGDVS